MGFLCVTEMPYRILSLLLLLLRILTNVSKSVANHSLNDIERCRHAHQLSQASIYTHETRTQVPGELK